MKIYLYSIGKSKRDDYSPLIAEYIKRIKRKVSFEEKEFKNEEQLFKSLKPAWTVVLADEKGNEPESSADFAGFLNKLMSGQTNNIVFIIGGAYGSSPELKKRASYLLSLAKITFPHRLAKLVLVEQIYRAFTIIAGEPYSH